MPSTLSQSQRQAWQRRFLQVFLPFLALIALASFLLWRTEREQAWLHQGELLQARLQLLARASHATLSDAATDLTVLANDPNLQRLLLKPPTQWGDYGEHFVSFLSFKPIYDQMRVLDLEGQERVRVLLNRGDPVVLELAQLQSQQNSADFQHSRQLTRGQIYLSALDLKPEEALGPQGLKPTLRLATPLYDPQGERRGLLVFNLLVHQLEAEFQRLIAADQQLALLDAQGQWLLGGLPEDRFARLLKRGQTLAQRDPALWQAMQTSPQGVLRGPDGLRAFLAVNPADPGVQAERLRLRLPFQADRATGWWLLLTSQTPVLLGNAPLRLALLFGLGGALAALVLASGFATLGMHGAARREREALYLDLFEQAPSAILLLDVQHHVSYANPAWYRLSGQQPEQALGESWLCLLGEADREAMLAALQALAQGETPRLICRLQRPDGRQCWVGCQLSRGPEWQSERYHAVLSLVDIDVQKEQERRLASALELVQGVLDGCGDPILVLDPQFRVTLRNPACGQAFGLLYGRAPEPGETLADWLSGQASDYAELQAHFSRAVLGTAAQCRLQLGPARRVFSASFSPLRDGQGECAGAILFARDVTAMAALQASVARNEELFRGVFASSLDAVFVLEAVRDTGHTIVDFKYIEAGGQPLGQSALRREELVGRLLSERPPLCQGQYSPLERYRQVVESGLPMQEELYLDHDQMAPGWYEVRAVSMGWGVAVSCRDISVRKQVELALASTEALQRNILDSAPYAIIAQGQDGLITLFNRAAEQLLGYRAEELIGRHSPVILHDSAELVRYAEELGAELGRPLEPDTTLFSLGLQHGALMRDWTYLCKDGRRIPVRLTLSIRRDAAGENIGTMGIAYDISAEKALEAERDRLHAVVEALPDMVRLSNLDEQVIYLNAAGRKLLGVAPDAPLDGLSLRFGYTEWSYKLIRSQAIPQALAGQPWQGETQWQRADGTVIDTLQLVVAPCMAGREPSFTATIVHDLSDLRAMERKMIEDEAMLNSILESVRDAIIVVDEAGVVQVLNPAVSEVYGLGLHQVMGRHFSVLMPPEAGTRQAENFQHYIQRGEQREAVIGARVEMPGRRADGTVFPAEVTTTEVRLGNRRLFTCVLRDISERKTFEARLLQNIEEMQETQAALNAANQQLLGANMELARMAQQDGLTGVANRRAFDQALEQEWQRAARSVQPLALLMIDVDHFKKYNDGYGHQLGDACLKQVASVLRATLSRPADVVARYGGEEFALILPETDADGARQVAARLRALLAEANIAHAFSPTAPRVTVSVGIAVLVPLHGVAADYLVSAADQALYRAKEDGRDRAVLAGAGA